MGFRLGGFMELIIRENDIELLHFEDKSKYVSEKILLKYINYIVYNNSLEIVTIHTIRGQFNYRINNIENRIQNIMVEIDDKNKDFVKYFVNVNNLFSIYENVNFANGNVIELGLKFVSSNETLLLTPSLKNFEMIRKYLN